MKIKIIASLIILGLSASLLMFMFVTGCGVTTDGGPGFVGPRIYVSDTTNGTVTVIDPISLTVLGSIELPGASAPKWMAIHPDGSKVYVSDYTANKIYIINTSNNVVDSVDVTRPNGITLGEMSGQIYLYVLSPQITTPEVVMFNANTKVEKGAIWGNNKQLHSACMAVDFCPLNQNLYITVKDMSEGTLEAIYADTGYQNVSGIPMLNAYDIAIDPSGATAYITSWWSSTGKLVSMECLSKTIVASWDATGGQGFRNVAVSPNGRYIIASNHDYSYVDLIDNNSGLTPTAIQTNSGMVDYYPGAVEGVTFSPDNKKAYVVQNLDLGTSGTREVVIINTEGASVEGTIALTTYPSTNHYFGIIYKP